MKVVINLFENFLSHSIYFIEYKGTLRTLLSKELLLSFKGNDSRKTKIIIWYFDIKVPVDLFKRTSWIIPYRKAESVQEEQDK